MEMNNLRESRKQHIANLYKSHLTEALAYGGDKLIFSKTGKDIKEKLQVVKDHCEDEKYEYYTQLIALRETLDCKPDQTPSKYLLRDFEDQITDLPMMYSWETIRNKKPAEEEYDSEKVSEYSGRPENETNPYERYNELVRCYIDELVEIAYIDLLLSQLEDNKRYDLSVKQIAALGFNKVVKSFVDEEWFEKARSGIYADTYQNRKLGRVGQKYGSKKVSVSKDKTQKDMKSEDAEGNEVKEGDKVKIHPNLTTDPQKKQGQVGKITSIHDDGRTVAISFEDGTSGLYTDGTFIKEKKLNRKKT